MTKASHEIPDKPASQLGVQSDSHFTAKVEMRNQFKQKVPAGPGELQRSTCHSLESSEGVSSEGLPGSAWPVTMSGVCLDCRTMWEGPAQAGVPGLCKSLGMTGMTSQQAVPPCI